MYCIKLRRPQEEFWNASVCQITSMIDIYADEKRMEAAAYRNEYYNSKYFNVKQSQSQIETITSMSEIGGVI
jgi:ribosomal protein L19E